MCWHVDSIVKKKPKKKHLVQRCVSYLTLRKKKAAWDTEGFLCLCSEGPNEEGPHIESFQPCPIALYNEPDWLMDKSQWWRAIRSSFSLYRGLRDRRDEIYRHGEISAALRLAACCVSSNSWLMKKLPHAPQRIFASRGGSPPCQTLLL